MTAAKLQGTTSVPDTCRGLRAMVVSVSNTCGFGRGRGYAETRALIGASGQVRGSGYAEREGGVGGSQESTGQRTGTDTRKFKGTGGWGGGTKKRTAG